MQMKHAGTIRGLGIAAIVLSALMLALCLLCAVVLGVTGTMLDDSMLGSVAYELAYNDFYDDFYDDYHYGYGYNDYGYGMSEFDPSGIFGILLTLGAVALGWAIITCVVSLIAGIMALRHSANAAKLGSVFVWSLVGASVALLSGRLITMAVLIVAAVFANKDRNDMQTAYWQAQNPLYGAAAAGSAGTGAATGATTASATATYPQPSAAYQQTYCQPQQPVSQPAAAVPYEPTAAAQPAQQPEPTPNSPANE